MVNYIYCVCIKDIKPDSFLNLNKYLTLVAYATISVFNYFYGTIASIRMSPFEINNALIPWMGKIDKEFTYLVQKVLGKKGVDLTKHQLVVLTRLSRNDGQPQSDLALITERDKTSLARLIATMERKNLVRREVNTKDKRVNNVFITQKGTQKLNDTMPIIKYLITEMQQGIPEKDIIRTIKILKKVKHNLENIDN